MGKPDQGARHRDPVSKQTFEKMRAELAKVIDFKVMTVLKLDPETLRSVRLYSSEPSYPVGGTKQRLCRQNEGSRATGDSFGADEFSDGHAIVIRHSSIPPPRLRGRRGVRGLIGVRERQNG